MTRGFRPRQARRATAVTVALLGATGLMPAGAEVSARNDPATSAVTAATGTWGATPTLAASGVPAPGTVSITYSHTLVLTTAPQYFYVANTGTRTLSGTSYTVDGIAGAVLGDPVITVRACTGGTWNTSTHACSAGSVTTVGTFTAGAPGPVESAVTAAGPGTRVQLQAAVSNFGLLGSFTAVFGTRVSSSAPRQVAGPLVSNS